MIKIMNVHYGFIVDDEGGRRASQQVDGIDVRLTGMRVSIPLAR